jgi:hypothetical protein
MKTKQKRVPLSETRLWRMAAKFLQVEPSKEKKPILIIPEFLVYINDHKNDIL